MTLKMLFVILGVKMFRQQCATRGLHSLHEDDGGCEKLVHASKVRKNVKETLYSLAKVREQDVKSNSFCLSCIQYAEKKSERQFTGTSSTKKSLKRQRSKTPSPSRSVTETSESLYIPVNEASVNSTNTDPVILLSMETLREDISMLTSEQKACIAFELGLAEHESIRQFSLSTSNEKQLNDLMDLRASVQIKKYNPVLSGFLYGITASKSGVKSHGTTSQNEDEVALCMAAESVMSLTTQIKVMPFHFRQMVLIYGLTRSRKAVGLLCKTGPFGSYQTLRSWLKDLSGEMPANPTGDLAAVFDNNQILQRRWKISVDNTVKCSVITMIIYMNMDKNGDLQTNPHFHPRQWMGKLPTEAVNKVKYIDQDPDISETRYTHCFKWLSAILNEVANEQKVSNTGITDIVDDMVEKAKKEKNFKTCSRSECKFDEVPKRARICPRCHNRLEKQKVEHSNKSGDKLAPTSSKGTQEIRVRVSREAAEGAFKVKYENLTNNPQPSQLQDVHPETPPEVTVGAPVMMNPCSFDAVAKVFREIGKQSGIRQYGGTREWVTVICDGLPYVLGSFITKKMYLCTICNESVMGKTSCSKHQHEQNQPQPNFILEFDWVLLQPGPGHIEWNMLKGLVKLLWPVYWEDMTELFNFRSENAKKAASKVTDFHKGWTLARIAHEALSKELVIPYVRSQLKASPNKELTAADFLKFTMTNTKNPNYAFLLDATFELLHSLFVYRDGVRSGNIGLMEAGRATMAKLFSARHHPMYRQIEMNDSFMYNCMPKDVKQHINSTMSVNLSGVPHSGEGADFKLETVNKAVQNFLPSVPTASDWQSACANLAPLQKLRKATFADLKVEEPKPQTPHNPPEIKDQVLAFRRLLRSNEYIKNPAQKCQHTSLKGNALDDDLVNFCKLAREKRAKFFEVFQAHASDPIHSTLPFKEPPVFVTTNERIDYELIDNKTIAEIKTRIQSLIESINDEDLRHFFEEEYASDFEQKKGKKPVKADYINYYHILSEFKEQETSLQTDSIPTEQEQEDEDSVMF